MCGVEPKPYDVGPDIKLLPTLIPGRLKLISVSLIGCTIPDIAMLGGDIVTTAAASPSSLLDSINSISLLRSKLRFSLAGIGPSLIATARSTSELQKCGILGKSFPTSPGK